MHQPKVCRWHWHFEQLKVEGRLELQIFPANVLFVAMTACDGRVIFGSALCEPEPSSLYENEDQRSMLYRNSYGGDWELEITYDKKEGVYYGEKSVGGVSQGLSFGKDWTVFVHHLGTLGLTRGEACMFHPFPPEQT